MSLLTNLISYWSCDESSGADAVDSHGINTLTPTGTGGGDRNAGILGNGINVERSFSDKFSITDASQSGLDITGNFSVSCWVKPESAPASGELYSMVSKWDTTGNQRGYQVYYYNDSGTKKLGLLVSSDGTNSTFIEDSNDLGTGTWFHIVWTYDASTQTYTMYKNDVVNSTGTFSATYSSIFNNSAPFILGQQSSNSSTYFDGMLDEIGIWNRVLDASEVTELYNSGAALAYPFGVTTPTGNAMFLGANM